MTSLMLAQRRRTGTALIAVGALLLALSAMMLVGLAPGARATHDGPQNANSFPPLAECGSEANRFGGWKVGINDNTWATGTVETHGVAAGDVTYSITSPTASHTVINPAQPGAVSPARYFNYNYTGSLQLQVVFLKIASSGTAYTTTTNPGSVLLPRGISHVTLCFSAPVADTTTTTVADTTTTTVADTTTTTVADTTTTTVADTTTTTVADTTTTTVADTTTTTVGGGDDPTTTTAGDTTTSTVLGGDDPDELPDTGPGELLALLAGGLGLTFIGSGSLVIAGDRRRAL